MKGPKTTFDYKDKYFHVIDISQVYLFDPAGLVSVQLNGIYLKNHFICILFCYNGFNKESFFIK